MLTAHSYTTHRCEQLTELADATLAPDIVWLDLHNGTAAEISFVERATGLKVPTLEELSEIETSSRLYSENGALFLSAPVIHNSQSHEPTTTPVGFILTATRLVTIRFAELPPFATFMERAAKGGLAHPSSSGAFVGIIEAIVDRAADILERIGSELDAVSREVFRPAEKRPKRRRPAREDANLRETLRGVGRAGDLVSKIRDSLLGIGRIVPYVTALTAEWMPAEMKPRLKSVRADIASLSDYDAYITSKIQFLLDATLGLINIEQNNIIKVLTVVSIVGVPPTFVASFYGMNFKHMPELDWDWGYPYGIALIVVSAVLPLVWFRLRGWL
jgi:magnesium transporter